MKKNLKIVLLIFVTLFMFGCGKEPEPIIEPPNNEPTNPPQQEVTTYTRPYAVMINCRNESLPQAGLDKAYLVYELNVEYGITRMLALFKDTEAAQIGSVRSARTQYLDYVQENNAIFVHAGGAKDALEKIKTLKISDIDVDNNTYGFRDTSLTNRDWEHKLFTKTEMLNKAVTDKKIVKTTEDTPLLTYSENEIDLSKYKTAKKATNVSIKYSNYRTAKYEYDSTSKNYLRFMNSTKNTDLKTNKQYTVKNIIAYSVKYTTYTNGTTTPYQKIDNIGTGEGYYITNGYYIPITWSKENEASKTIYKIKETNEELIINNGNTYIQIFPTNGTISVK